MGQEEEAVLKPAVVFSWEPVVVKKPPPPPAAEARRDDVPPGSPKKAPQPPARRLSVPPPPGRAPATRSLSSRARAVRPEDDPFLAAYLACTKSSGGRRGGNGKQDAGGGAPAKGRRRFTWAGLGLSCKSSAGAVEKSMVKVAKRPELDPARDDA